MAVAVQKKLRERLQLPDDFAHINSEEVPVVEFMLSEDCSAAEKQVRQCQPEKDREAAERMAQQECERYTDKERQMDGATAEARADCSSK